MCRIVDKSRFRTGAVCLPIYARPDGNAGCTWFHSNSVFRVVLNDSALNPHSGSVTRATCLEVDYGVLTM